MIEKSPLNQSNDLVIIMSTVDISNLDKGLLLLYLVSATSSQGLGWLSIENPALNEVSKIAESQYVDYFMGHPIKTDLRGNMANSGLYNRDAGAGVFERVVESMRKNITYGA